MLVQIQNPNSTDQIIKRIKDAEFTLNYNLKELDNYRIISEVSPTSWNKGMIEVCEGKIKESIHLIQVLGSRLDLSNQSPEIIKLLETLNI